MPVKAIKTDSAGKPRSDLALANLRRRILSGAIAPGALLAESAMARELGVSRVPVREALFALEREGLVVFSDTGRAFVRQLSPRDFEELLQLRLTLEPMAARLAAAQIQPHLHALRTNIAATRRARSLAEVTRLDLEFHELILTASGNGRLLKLWRSMRGVLERWLGRLHRQHQGQRLDTCEQTACAHEGLLKPFSSHNASLSESKMREHILNWREWLPLQSGQ